MDLSSGSPVTTGAASRIIMAALGLFVVLTWWANVHNLDIEFAWHGYTPQTYVHKLAEPEAFAKDFPSGVEEFGNSAFMRVYPLAYSALGISPETLTPLIIGFEIAIMALAACALCRVLRPESPPIVAFLFTIMVLASSACDMGLARYSWPMLAHGLCLYYYVTGALRLFAIVMVLKGRPVAAAALLAGSFVTYPPQGMIAGIFILATFAVTPRLALKRRYIAGAVVFIVPALLWLLVIFAPGGLPAEKVSDETWFGLTRLGSYHLYPVEAGLFTTWYRQRFVQFLSFLLLLLYYGTRMKPRSEIDRKVSCGLAALMATCIAGVIISAVKPSRTLVMLSLHRANDLVCLVGLAWILAGLWREIETGPLWRKAVALAVLVSPFLLKPGYPLVFSLLIAAPALYACFTRKDAGARNWAVTAFAMGLVAFVIAWNASEIPMPPSSAAEPPITFNAMRNLQTVCVGNRLLLVIAGSYFAVILAVWMFCRKRLSAQLAKVLAGAACACLALVWTYENGFDRFKPDAAGLRRDYMEAQLWARDNTPKGTLFMTDPTIGYSWRAWSQRPSFGTLREWQLAGWVYSLDAKTCEEGKRRMQELSVDIDEFVRNGDTTNESAKLYNAIREGYYSMTDAQRLEMAGHNGIDYFVLRREHVKTPSYLRVAFENKRFVVLKAAEGRPGGTFKQSLDVDRACPRQASACPPMARPTEAH